jgi:hypothetical protein
LDVAEDALYVLLRCFVHVGGSSLSAERGRQRGLHEGRAESAVSQRPNWFFVSPQSRVFFEDRLRSLAPLRKTLLGCSQGGYSDSE